ncbi:MAG: NAD(P)-dependent oxidoreductase [Anaerolineae bacterium]|nr:NAD(P)-dependent oxidoreductase [Anaerolineae bacterium]
MVKPHVPAQIGFIGFGQVASTFSRALIAHSARIFAYDSLLEQDGGRELLQERAEGLDICFCALPDMLKCVDVVLCTASTHVAVEIAEQCVPLFRSGQIYLDLNSTSPAVKVAIDRIVGRSPADFVEGAILGAVGTGGARVRILVCGGRGQEIAGWLNQFGLNLFFYGNEIGRASTFKMLRSIFSKGLEALLIEFLVAAKRAGLENDLWDEVVGLMHHHPFEESAANWVRTHSTAYERRYHEMVQVTRTVREMGIEPIMTAATEAFFERSLSLGLRDAFEGKPGEMDRVIAVLEQYLGDSG